MITQGLDEIDVLAKEFFPNEKYDNVMKQWKEFRYKLMEMRNKYLTLKKTLQNFLPQLQIFCEGATNISYKFQLNCINMEGMRVYFMELYGSTIYYSIVLFGNS